MRGRTVATLLSMTVMALSGGLHAEVAAEGVDVWMTTADGSQRLKSQPSVRFAPDPGVAGMTVTIDDETAYQTIDGFGASLTDTSAALIWKLKPAQRNELLRRLFDPQSGIGLSFLRQPMGASDFSTVGNYSYDDMPPGETDPELRHFTIAHDLEYIVPELKQIRAINPKLKLMANPWSPPGWMKTTGSMIGGNLRSEARAAWAAYFVKFVKAYEAEGVPIDYLSLQNEPLNVPLDYPGMGMDASTQADLLANHLGPALARARITARVLGWDHNWTNSYPYEVLEREDAYPYAAGTAWHCYGGKVESQGELQRVFPQKDHWQTECSGFSGGSFARDLHDDVATLIIGVTRNWGRSSVRWNLVLDEKGGPRNGGCPNCTALVTIDSHTGAVRYNVDYYGFGHASRFVVPGATRIESNTFDGSIETVAFANPDGSNVLVAFNAASAPSGFRVSWRGQSFRYTLPAGAAATFRWKGRRPKTHLPLPAPVPLEGTNLAARKPATASSAERAETDPSLAVDGNTFTRWSSAFSDPQWITVDLGEAKAIGRVRLNWESACAREYQIQVSNDGADWTTVADVRDGHAGVDERRVAAQGRYVRVYGTARATEYGYSLWEMEVYGTSAASVSEAVAAVKLETK
jgi:glucosylceramidase